MEQADTDKVWKTRNCVFCRRAQHPATASNSNTIVIMVRTSPPLYIHNYEIKINNVSSTCDHITSRCPPVWVLNRLFHLKIEPNQFEIGQEATLRSFCDAMSGFVMMRWFNLRNFPDVGPHTTPFPTSKSTRVLYIFLFWESLESNLGLSFQFVWNRMNLDPLSFALAEISYSVSCLTKKNYKPSVAEINHVSRNSYCSYCFVSAEVFFEDIPPFDVLN